MRLNQGKFIFVSTAVLFFWGARAFASHDGIPPGSPGVAHTWSPALKQAVGTAFEPQSEQSPVWFTVAEGILTEVYYPVVDQPQTGDLQFLVTDGTSFFSEQKRDTRTQVRYLNDGMTVEVQGEEKKGAYRFRELIITDPEKPVVRVQLEFEALKPDLKLFLLFKPAIGNNGADNLAVADREALVAQKSVGIQSATPVAAVVPLGGFTLSSAGFVGVSDGWQTLSKKFALVDSWPLAGPGNVALVGALPPTLKIRTTETIEFALSFGTSPTEAVRTAQTSFQKSFHDVQVRYEKGWNSYLSRLKARPGAAFLKNDRLARISTAVMKMHEDKHTRGAIVASLSKPGIPGAERSGDNQGGYHLVWPRDLYHAATGLLAAGDKETANEVLDFLDRVQNTDGSWSQNFWVDGTPYWKAIQMDEVAFPILLAAQFNSHQAMVKKAADYIVRKGPFSQQDRWEEVAGALPNTIAVQIAALKVATRMLGDIRYKQLAEQWTVSLNDWTLVRSSDLGDNYFLRVSPSGNAHAQEIIEIANGGGKIKSWAHLDGGFLDLARLGVIPGSDSRIQNTLAIYDAPGTGITFQAYGGTLHRRYNRDAYGPSQSGGYWPLLSGERGHYALLVGDRAGAHAQAALMERSALASGLIPEQIIGAPRNSLGADSVSGLGVACPLVWAHAEYVRLIRSLQDNQVFDRPVFVH